MKSRSLTELWQSAVMRRDLKHTDRALAALSDPRPGDVLDVALVRAELARLIGPATPERATAEDRAAIDGFVDSYTADFLRAMQERHGARLGELDRLESRMIPYQRQLKLLLHDESTRLADLDAVIENVLDRLVDSEHPHYDPRQPRKPRESQP